MDPKTSDELLIYLEFNDIPAQTFEHPPVHTVDESQHLRGNILGQHTKNLFLRDGKKKYFLFVTDENTSVNLKALGRMIGAKSGLSFGSSHALMDLLGVLPGSISVLAAINDKERRVTIVLDEQLMQAPTINCHPLTNTRTTSLSQEGLVRFLAATGHAPLFVSLQAPPSR